MVDFDDELGILEFVYLYLYDLTVLYFMNPFTLNNWSGSWVYVEMVADYIGIYSGHVLCCPHKNMFVSS